MVLVLINAGGVDFQIKKWGLKGEALFVYALHHTSIRWICMVKLNANKMQMWSSSNDAEIAQCLVLDDVENHDMVGTVTMCRG